MIPVSSDSEPSFPEAYAQHRVDSATNATASTTRLLQYTVTPATKPTTQPCDAGGTAASWLLHAGASGQSPHEHFKIGSQHVGTCSRRAAIGAGISAGSPGLKSNWNGEPMWKGFRSFTLPMKSKKSCSHSLSSHYRRCLLYTSDAADE